MSTTKNNQAKNTNRKQNLTVPKKSIQNKSLINIHGQLNDWAHAGTKKSIDNLCSFIVKEKDEGLRGYAQIALDEAQFFYYSPNTKQEEKEFLLGQMVHRHEDRLWKLMSKADGAKLELRELDLDREVHQKVMASKPEKMQEEWKYNFCEDYYCMVAGRLAEIEDELYYESAWIKEAKKLIKTEKYQNIPDDILEHVHWDGEGVSFWNWDEDDYEDNEDYQEIEKDRYEECPF